MKLTLHCDDNNRLGDLQESSLRFYELDVLFVHPCMNCRVSSVFFFKVIRPLDDASRRQYVPDRCGLTLDCIQAWIITQQLLKEHYVSPLTQRGSDRPRDGSFKGRIVVQGTDRPHCQRDGSS
jgi:hypothetical protein